MIDHLTLLVSDYTRSLMFYMAALKPLGYSVAIELDHTSFPDLPVANFAGLGTSKNADFFVRPSKQVAPTHVAFRAKDRASVDAFYQAALAAGAKPNGAPGLRPEHHPNYYAAFVLDPDGYNVEAVCHDPVK